VAILREMKRLYKILLVFVCLLPFLATASSSQEHGAEEEFNPGKTIMDHIGDAHDWHIATIGHNHVSLPLPVIIYNKTAKKLDVFMSSAFHHGETEYKGYKLVEGHIVPGNSTDEIYDLSVTKNVASILLSAVLLLGVFFTIAARYKKNPQAAPTGIQSFFEPIIVFIRDDIGKNMIGPKYEKFMPYLLTIFFFIWFNNILGLFPGGANVTGNLAVTMVLAILTFIITNINGNKYYWGHLFNPPGLPLPIKFLIVPIEIVSLFTKPFSLTVRLFANISAGHIIILSLLSLIFIFKSEFASLISLPFAIFMMVLELFVAILQAYIFTLLSAMYIAAAVDEHHHDDHSVDKALY
jgi:F-type H+-transporting ATPase subunit a